MDPPNGLSYCQKVALALISLKQKLQQDYEQKYPDFRGIIPAILADEERNAWEISLFPHLLLPGLIEERIAELTCASTGESAQAMRILPVDRKSRTLTPLAQLEVL